jgi:hypothetical protein
MMDDNYQIKWKHHTTEAFEVVNRLHRVGAFADVVLFCGYEQFLANKIILAACSAYFERVFTNLPAEFSNKSVVIMRDTDSAIFKRVLGFMYDGRVQVPAGQLNELMRLAESLEIRGLKNSGKQNNAKPTAAAAPISRKPIAENDLAHHNSVIKKENVIADNQLAVPVEFPAGNDQPPSPKKAKLTEPCEVHSTELTPIAITLDPSSKSAAIEGSVSKAISAADPAFQVS